ncbi:MAG: phage holin family protein [Bacteroidales bacterium]
MENNTLSESFSELSDVIKSYVDARIRYWKVLLLEKSTRAGTYLFTSIAVLVCLLAFLIFLGFAFSFWYGETRGSIWVGFLISAGFALLLLLGFCLFRKRIFSRNIIRNIRKLVLPEDEEN